MVACSGADSREAKTRKEQEVEFNKAFGFHPPATITTINHTYLSSRNVIDRSYDEWLSFTFEQASFDKIIRGKYKQAQNIAMPDESESPAWWPKANPSGTVLFFRSQDDTSTDEGFQFREYIWHDKASGLVFFHKSYWG